MVVAKKKKILSPKKTLTAIWDEFLYSSGFVAVGDILAIYTFSLILKIQISISFIIVIFLSILAINFYNRYKELQIDQLTNPQRSLSVKRYSQYAPHIIISLLFISAAITALFSNDTALLFMLVLFAAGILYTLILKRITQKIIGFKNFMTAIPYALLVIFLAIYHEESVGLSVVLISIFYFLRIFINTTYFDIKDVISDKKVGLKTFPIVLGIARTKRILQTINYLSVIPILVGIFCGVLPIYSIGLLLTIFYARAFLNIKEATNQKLIYNIMVDGEFILWPIYVLIMMKVVG